MGIGKTFAEAFEKAQLSAGETLPPGGKVFISVRDRDKAQVAGIGRALVDIGFEVLATRGTADALRGAGVECEVVNKVREGRPHIVDMLKNDEISYIINTTEGQKAIADSFAIRRTALERKITYSTTLAGAGSMVSAIAQSDALVVCRLRDLHEEVVA